MRRGFLVSAPISIASFVEGEILVELDDDDRPLKRSDRRRSRSRWREQAVPESLDLALGEAEKEEEAEDGGEMLRVTSEESPGERRPEKSTRCCRWRATRGELSN